MKFLNIAWLSVVLFHQVNSECNVCDTDTKFACFSQSQFIPCNKNGVLDLTKIANCPNKRFCNEGLSPDPCFTLDQRLTTCPIKPIKFISAPPKTTTALGRPTTSPRPTSSTTPVSPPTSSTKRRLRPTWQRPPSTPLATLPPTNPANPASSSTTWPPPTTVIGTTSLSIYNATTWCQGQETGNYPHPSYATCTHYIYCYLNSGTKGSVYTCAGSTRFNPATELCDPTYLC